MTFPEYLRQRSPTDCPIGDFASAFAREPLPFDGTLKGLLWEMRLRNISAAEVQEAAKAAFLEYEAACP